MRGKGFGLRTKVCIPINTYVTEYKYSRLLRNRTEKKCAEEEYIRNDEGSKSIGEDMGEDSG